MPVPMSLLFEACQQILEELLTPTHYGKLTELALANLGNSLRGQELSKAKEDVREKMLLANRRETFYVPWPHGCLACLRKWFARAQPSLFNEFSEETVIPADASVAIAASLEALCRKDYMLTKNPHCDPKKRWEGLARGMILEKHVAAWFQKRWPQFYRLPENHGQYARHCDHDFKIAVGDFVRTVDVMGPLADGSFGMPERKSPADIHLLASVCDDHFLLHGWNSGEEICTGVCAPALTHPLCRLIVWLNCQESGIDYAACRRFAEDRTRRKIATHSLEGQQ